ncbi:MAG: hypothetical protein PHI47_08435 [Sulfuricurvum sp.]|uniref:hypothetical protein n=1 Tax=Sulfuricurvum sp. TaxID=2025608 RepID=UPI00262BF42A|nr:hypothetical protein [Sulfuricurvum sp.]MDD5160062.1 hypothetical protein [Sulfuricurvum sp.]
MKTNLSIVFLDSQRILEKYLYEGSLNDKELQNNLFVEAHSRDPYKPDYVFKNAMEDFTKKKSEDIDAYYLNDSKISKSTNDLLFDTLEELAKMLVFQGEKIYVNNHQFEKWQNTILSISPLIIISYAIFKQSKESFHIKPENLIKSIFSKTALPSIYEPQLDSIINNGLNEMHMHLTGTTEVDIVWHDALQQPQKFYSYIKKSLKDSTVTEQYLQIGHFKQDDFYRLLKIASQIRDQMLSMIDSNCDEEKANSYFTKETFDIGKTLCYASTNHPISLIENVCLDSKMQYESLFIIRSLEYLASSKSIYFGHLFHYYILIYSYFQKLLVQQKTQVGFDQFQKITLNELRETTEKVHYNNRYYQLQGMYDNSLSILEGRFAPKDNLKDILTLLKDIHAGYDKKLQKKFKLKLVPHFTKHLEKRNPEKIITFRDLELRLKNKKALDFLLESLKYHNEKGEFIYKELIVGFDSAANELHASPEAFSPIFRKLAFLGYKNFTYHAGEDFVHILSGLRMVYEAVDFLEMQSGNRIGHATALGIEPKLWNQRLYDSKLTIKTGEWLDNLVFAYNFCSETQTMYKYLAKLEESIRRYFNEIYGSGKYYSMYQIIQAWKSRKYDPFIVFEWREPSLFDDFESKELKQYNKIDEDVRSLYEAYHEGCNIAKYNKMIQIIPLEIFGVDELRLFQNMMIEFLNKKNIAIETLPTSNVRISYYKEYSEHHLIRWLGLKSVDDPKPNVVVGSDDTGIFMTNLRNEYAHAYQMINKKLSTEETLQKIELLNKNSKAFTFSN